ncbi:hypothetical protein M406DRAFT_267261 [Cryphonectria parasitica EP155]|uniref:TLC domain-containing protein n=1 Tax=Cryphonectria parasitica (strain ATCC 38755 / EP155) TaxID=660469 RepID=A0A9P5CKW8_CRYP1|nr:uncharacterized protein M406DRAFT_267261 [Cryphonectria parasitica EP155]KAF3761210.1 hypothetical protein M406DRAFT_267261 [Cryphonectria parasitica EP155]
MSPTQSTAQVLSTIHRRHDQDSSKDRASSPSSRSWSSNVSKRLSRSHKAKQYNKPSDSQRRVRPGRAPGTRHRTWAPPLVLVSMFLCFYAVNPHESNIIHHFLFLSYKQKDPDDDPSSSPAPSYYGKGPWDLAFVFFYTIVLSFTREFLMHEVLRPLARACGITSPRTTSRFTEQMYTACYTALSGPLGLLVMRRTPGLWYFETRGMYEGYPHQAHEGLFKFYYLFQAAFWIQQVVVMVLGQEQRRKDFREFVAHHVVTVALIGLSYRFHFMRIGIAIYVTHDISDGLLAIVKSLNYAQSSLQAPVYALCMACWIYLRHYINLRVLYSILTEFSAVGPFELDWAAEQYKCRISQVVTFGLLAGLQALNLFWLYCLFRSAYRFVMLGIAKDDRSEAEESEGEEVDNTVKGRRPGGETRIRVE